MIKRVANHAPGIRKAHGVGKARPVVHNHHVKPQIGGIAAQRLGHMPAAKEDQPLRRQEHAGIDRLAAFFVPRGEDQLRRCTA